MIVIDNNGSGNEMTDEDKSQVIMGKGKADYVQGGQKDDND